MPSAVGALNERHTRNDAQWDACAFFAARIAYSVRPYHRAAALRSTLASLRMAARLTRKQGHGAARPSGSGPPESESTRNLPPRGNPFPLGERREPRALYRPAGAGPDRRVGRFAIPALISPGADSLRQPLLRIAGCSDRGPAM